MTGPTPASPEDKITLSEFLRLFPMRGPNLMWLLGAGASAASGIPTAGDMLWDFKRRIYCAEQRISIRACDDLSNPIVQEKIQRYLDRREGCPPLGSEEEYSHYFSTVFANEADRRLYIDQMISKAVPSFGFLALAVLMKQGQTRVVWTTNFDRNIEDASATTLKTTGKLIVSTLDVPHLMREALEEGRSPLLGKLHGDFQSRRLKNTSDELQAQDAQLRREFIEACKRSGLIVVGYSGRDHSVMEAIEEAIDGGRGYPSGLFWFSRGKPATAVTSLIEKARANGVQAYIIEVQTFDELLADIVAQIPNLSAGDADFLNSKVSRLTDVPLAQERGSWPIVRLNALQIVKFPSVCRLVTCEIGGMREVKVAIQASGAHLVASRRRAGVLVFGRDTEVRKAFSNHKISAMDLHTIEPQRMFYDSAEAGLLYEALARALVRERPLLMERKRGRYILRIDPTRENSEVYLSLRNVLGTISGKILGTDISWTEAIEIHLEYRFGRLWLIIEPIVWAATPILPEIEGEQEIQSEEQLTKAEQVKTERSIVRDFLRERQATRYNRQWNDLLEAWAKVISANQTLAKVSAFGASEGVDAVFEIGGTTGYSYRLRRR